jgi:hypothetical protein
MECASMKSSNASLSTTSAGTGNDLCRFNYSDGLAQSHQARRQAGPSGLGLQPWYYSCERMQLANVNRAITSDSVLSKDALLSHDQEKETHRDSTESVLSWSLQNANV